MLNNLPVTKENAHIIVSVVAPYVKELLLEEKADHIVTLFDESYNYVEKVRWTPTYHYGMMIQILL